MQKYEILSDVLTAQSEVINLQIGKPKILWSKSVSWLFLTSEISIMSNTIWAACIGAIFVLLDGRDVQFI